jgi:hypothetical protein
MTMTSDLLVCLIAIFLISAGLFAIGIAIGSRSRRLIAVSAAAFAIAILVAYAVWLTDNPILTRILPVANVLLWGNLQLPAAAFLGGIAWSSLKTPLWQRILLIGALLYTGIWRETAPVVGHRPPVGTERWTHGICRQTSTSSCSAAAAATLLNIYGITTTESEMIDACLTHIEGTTTLGLYRGLKLKTAGTAWDVRADKPHADSIDHWPLPAVVTVSLPGLDKSLLIGHSLVVVRVDGDGKFDIADPFVGWQRWTRGELMDAYGGAVMTLVPRNRPAVK